jgi:type I restriction-modification system DNA methylase subunit
MTRDRKTPKKTETQTRETEFDKAFQAVGKLVETFQRHESKYKSANYSEAAARKDFVDKFWTALGWDVNHERQTNPYEQEVKVERPVPTGGSQRRADYAFYLAPNFHDVKFFVEAKKPFVDIGTSENYFQLIRYGWNSETPIAALTDFEQLHVLDCRYKPDLDTAFNRCLAKYHYSDYAKREKFAEIYWLFSREAVVDGSIEKRAKDLPKPRGKAVQRGLFAGGWQSIDESFLAELDDHRKSLAQSFKNRNPQLDRDALTELAQRTIDRLVFLRFLEDKGIEPERLVENFGDKGTAWEDFVAASRRLDRIYNGIVYKRHDILDGSEFRVDDNVFASVCESLSHANSPYDFNAIPTHILGSIYERFLGKVIVATEKRVRVEEKPEVRKAGGVYYTPEYIVRYIVENTIGKLIAGKTPDQIAKMRFADIACGSGSFLLGVFDVLLNYHGRYYNENPGKDRKGDCVKRDGKLYLALAKKREILLNNIYGVDIDAQAVEVCQLSLSLKLLQEETEASTHQYRLDFEHVARMKKLLPDLSKNIVCGNSLVGTDIVDGQLFDRGEERKLNPMNFGNAFPEVMKRGGFDAIVGNPPYSYRNATENVLRPYFLANYKCAEGNFDTYKFFLERTASLLCKAGKVGMIVSATFLVQPTFRKLRSLLLSHFQVELLCPLGPSVFAAATVDTAILIARRTDGPNTEDIEIVVPANPEELPKQLPYNISQQRFVKNPGQSFDYKLSNTAAKIVDALFAKFPPIESSFEFGVGINTGYIRDELVSDRKRGARYHPMVPGTGISRYGTVKTKGWIMYDADFVRQHGRQGRTLPAEHLLSSEKILVVRTRNLSLPRRVIATIDSSRAYNLNRLSNIVARRGNSIKGLLGILNSNLFNWLFSSRFYDYEIKPVYLRASPMADVNDARLVKLVGDMLEAKRELAQAQTDRDKTYYENKCAGLDQQIDRIVYDLYGLTEKEIRIVEGTEE